MSTELSSMYYDPTASGRDRYAVEVRNHGLNKFKIVRAYDPEELQKKVDATVSQWNEQWARKKSVQARKQIIESGKQSAIDQTLRAQNTLDGYKEILKTGLNRDPKIDWDRKLNHTSFNEPRPKKPVRPPKPSLKQNPRRPEETDEEFRVELGLLDKIFASRRRQKEVAARKAYNESVARWEKQCKKVESTNKGLVTKWENRIAEQNEKWDTALAGWDDRKAKFEESKDKQNQKVLATKKVFERGEPSAVVEYFHEVLKTSPYSNLPKPSFEIDLDLDQGVLVCDYQLPPLSALQTLEKVTFVQSRQEFNEKHLADRIASGLYESVLYQICLRSIHELFASDEHEVVQSIVFNGWVRSIDKATGQDQNSCILSIQVLKQEYQEVNLSLVDPKECFKSWKGVSAAKLADVAPIAPLRTRLDDDSRFVQSYAVADSISEGENLASMDWEDFEHLVRELFESEFAKDGGEVKVTKASRDGGVDAIANDPDPIRGGKIVIQAKRYTNTVDVSSVRELYGTVVNEGAIKGILITTSDFGGDAHKFAASKPITLINGGQLLHMLAAHGKSARIDLKEAKRILKGKSR